MFIEKGSDPETTHKIKPSEGEGLRAILRAIAIASFEQSRPVSMGWLRFDGGSTLTPEKADRFIRERNGKLSLDMDYVEGRQIKTFLEQDNEGNLDFNSWLYQRDRGNPEPMFERAEEVLSGKNQVSMPPEVISTKKQFKGESLDLRLSELGYRRLSGESDINYRKRIFPELYRKDSARAFEFLWGQSAAEWDETQGIEYVVISSSIKDKEDLAKYAGKYSEDPQDKSIK